MDEQEYLKSRVDDQIQWYDKRSQAAKNRYRRLRIFEIVGAAVVPFLAAYADKSVVVQVALGLLGVLLAVGAGLLSLDRYQEQWVEYRAASEALVREKTLFLTKTPPYDGAEPFKLLVQRAEAIMATENRSWMQAFRGGAKEGTKDGGG